MDTTDLPDLTDLQRNLVVLIASAALAKIPVGPTDLAEATGADRGDVLAALDDLTTAGVITNAPTDDPSPVQVTHDNVARLPLAHRVVLLHLMTIPEATPATLADVLPGGYPAAERAVAQLITDGLVTTAGPDGAVYHSKRGWAQTVTEVETGPAAGDPLSLRLIYALWEWRRVMAEAEGHTLSDVAAEIMSTQ